MSVYLPCLQASGFCYVNDIVLAILELLKYHARCACPVMHAVWIWDLCWHTHAGLRLPDYQMQPQAMHCFSLLLQQCKDYPHLRCVLPCGGEHMGGHGFKLLAALKVPECPAASLLESVLLLACRCHPVLHCALPCAAMHTVVLCPCMPAQAIILFKGSYLHAVVHAAAMRPSC